MNSDMEWRTMNKFFKLVNKSEYVEIMSNKNIGRLHNRNMILIAIDEMANFMSFDLLFLFDDVDFRESNTILMVNDVKMIINVNGINIDWDKSTKDNHIYDGISHIVSEWFVPFGCIIFRWLNINGMYIIML